MVRRPNTLDRAMIGRESVSLSQVRVAVWIALVLFVPFYFHRHADLALRLIHNADALLYVAIIVNLLLAWMARAARDLAIYRNQGVRIGFFKLLILNNYQFSLNYLPMKLGTLQLAAYLKDRYGLAYSAYAGAFLVQNILVSIVASILSIGTILLFADLGAVDSRLLLGAFSLIAVAMFWASFTTLRLGFLPVSLTSRLTAIHGEISRFARMPMTATWSLLMSVTMFILTVWRLELLSRILDFDVDVVELVLFSAVSQLSLLLAVTPGALGVREFFMGALARLFGFSSAIGVLLSLSERLIALGLSLLFAVVSPRVRRPTEVWGSNDQNQ
jgi:uncharacterized membrane protein YbhN (UPF0104 family)